MSTVENRPTYPVTLGALGNVLISGPADVLNPIRSPALASLPFKWKCPWKTRNSVLHACLNKPLCKYIFRSKGNHTGTVQYA